LSFFIQVFPPETVTKMTSFAIAILFTNALLLLLTSTPSTARSVGDLEKECSTATCGEGPFCFGFLTKDAKSYNGGRGSLPDADPCFDNPSRDACKDKPWAAVSKTTEKEFKVELVAKGNSVGMILFNDREPPTDPLAEARLITYCKMANDKDEVKIWRNPIYSQEKWNDPDKTTSASIEKQDDGYIVCQFQLDSVTGGVDLNGDTFYRVALFQGETPPQDDKITSSDQPLSFFKELKVRSEKDNKDGGDGIIRNDAVPGIRAPGGITITLLAITSIYAILGR
jgi:hypothetical protein